MLLPTDQSLRLAVRSLATRAMFRIALEAVRRRVAGPASPAGDWASTHAQQARRSSSKLVGIAIRGVAEGLHVGASRRHDDLPPESRGNDPRRPRRAQRRRVRHAPTALDFWRTIDVSRLQPCAWQQVGWAASISAATSKECPTSTSVDANRDRCAWATPGTTASRSRGFVGSKGLASTRSEQIDAVWTQTVAKLQDARRCPGVCQPNETQRSGRRRCSITLLLPAVERRLMTAPRSRRDQPDVDAARRRPGCAQSEARKLSENAGGTRTGDSGEHSRSIRMTARSRHGTSCAATVTCCTASLRTASTTDGRISTARLTAANGCRRTNGLDIDMEHSDFVIRMPRPNPMKAPDLTPASTVVHGSPLVRRTLRALAAAGGVGAALLPAAEPAVAQTTGAAADDTPPGNRIAVSTYSFWRFKDDSKLLASSSASTRPPGWGSTASSCCTCRWRSEAKDPAALQRLKQRAFVNGLDLCGFSTHQGFLSPDEAEAAEEHRPHDPADRAGLRAGHPDDAGQHRPLGHVEGLRRADGQSRHRADAAGATPTRTASAG